MGKNYLPDLAEIQRQAAAVTAIVGNPGMRAGIEAALAALASPGFMAAVSEAQGIASALDAAFGRPPAELPERRDALRQAPIAEVGPAAQARRQRARAADPREIVRLEKAFIAGGGLAKDFADEVNLHPRTIRRYRRLCGE